MESFGAQNRELLLEATINDLKGEILGLKYQLERANEPRDGEAGDADEYQQFCVSRAGKHAIPLVDFATLGLGIAGEAGEVADVLKKHIGHGHALNVEKIREELGDTLWYVAVIAQRIVGSPLSEIMSINETKLRKRYPNGFSTADSIARVDVSPRPSTTEESAGMVRDSLSDLRPGRALERIPAHDGAALLELEANARRTSPAFAHCA